MNDIAASEQLPPIQIEWVAAPGDARRATLSSLRTRRTWTRPLIIAVVAGATLTWLCIATGSGWLLGIAIGLAACAAYVAFLVAVCLLSAHLRNRKVLRPGDRWGSGANDFWARFDTPGVTMLFRRTDILTVTDAGPLVVVTVARNQSFAFPRALFVEPVWRRLNTDPIRPSAPACSGRRRADRRRTWR